MGRLEKALRPSCVLEQGWCQEGPRQDGHAGSGGFVGEAARAWQGEQGLRRVVRPIRRRRTLPLRPAQISRAPEAASGSRENVEMCVCVCGPG